MGNRLSFMILLGLVVSTPAVFSSMTIEAGSIKQLIYQIGVLVVAVIHVLSVRPFDDADHPDFRLTRLLVVWGIVNGFPLGSHLRFSRVSIGSHLRFGFNDFRRGIAPIQRLLNICYTPL